MAPNKFIGKGGHFSWSCDEGPAKDRTKMWACFQTFTDHFFSFETRVQFYFSGSFKTSRWKCALLLAEFSNESLQKSLNVTLSWEISPK